MTRSPSTFYLLQDVGCLSGPNERLGVGVVLRDVSFNGLDQLFDISEATASDLFLSDVSKEALDHVEPGSTGRSEMNMEAGMSLQPSLPSCHQDHLSPLRCPHGDRSPARPLLEFLSLLI